MEANRVAAAKPMPEAPPVITATAPADNLVSELNITLLKSYRTAIVRLAHAA
jgi:hypothetical protein